MIVDLNLFCEQAQFFDKHGHYDCGIKGSLEYEMFKKREADRCLNGLKINGLRISGYYYHYLNYCRIQKVIEDAYSTKSKTGRKSGKRVESFPEVWDVDLMYFAALDIAEFGVGNGNGGYTWEEYEFLQKNVTLNIREDQLDGGHHLIWLKPRGVGASYKGAALAHRNYVHIEGSMSLMLADQKEYLVKDGLWSKFLDYRDWLNVHAPFFRRDSDYKNDRNDMHIRASIDDGSGNEVGYKSEVMGVSLKGDWQKARGKRSKVILWEELGKFPNADKAWEVARPSVEQGDVTYGTMVGFGTGGVEGSDFEALRKIHYNPRDYNVLCFDNILDPGVAGTDIAMFTPAYMSVQFKDYKGTSNQELARAYYDKERLQAESSKDETLAPRKKAEFPYNSQEAVLNTAENIFASEILTQHKAYIEVSELYKSCANVGEFWRTDEGSLKFKLKHGLKPIWTYPHTNYEDLAGAPVILENPIKVDGIVPRNLYQINVDTYRHESTTSTKKDGSIKGFRGSIGAVYVTMNQTNLRGAGRGDRIVAYYHGKPKMQDDFNRIIFYLAEYYNCIGGVAFENDEPGDLVGFAKRNKKLKYLADEFELAYDENLKGSHTRRGFGMSMGSGKENKRKRQGDLYIKDWLYTLRVKDEITGKEVLNLHTIKDLGLLQELCGYNPDGNFDRISALRIMVYHQQELLYNEVTVKDPSTNRGNAEFFRRQHYRN